MNFTSDFDPTHTFASAIAGGIEGAIGLVLNTLSIFVILKSDKLRKNVLAPLICALAISDIIFCLSLTLLLPQFYNNQPYPEGSIKCILSPLSYRCAILSSVLCLSMISLQRVLSMRSLNSGYSFFTPLRTLAFMLLLWTLLVSYLLLPALNVWDKIGHRPGYPFCTVWKNNKDAVLHPDTLIYFLGYAFPLLFLIVCYSLMYKQLKDCTFRAGKEGKMTKAALIMVGSYILIYTPGFVNYLFNKDISGERVSQILALVSYNTGWSHAFINPIISILFNPLYRNECLKVLKIKKEEPFRKSVFHSIRTSRTYYSPNKIEWV